MRRALLVALLVTLAVPAGASGHARLVGTTPERGATVERSPQRVVFRFDEPVEAAFGAVRVYDARAGQVDDGRLVRPGERSDEIAVGLPEDLPDGSYTATYRLVSADGHPISGGLVFSVGEPGAGAASVDQLLGDDAGPQTATAFAAARAVAYGATALLAGGLLFLLLCWGPALRGLARRDPGDDVVAAGRALEARARVVLLAAAAAGALAAAAGVVLQAATASGQSFWGALDPSVVEEVLGTRSGQAWGLRAVAFLVLAAGLVALRRRRAARALVAAAALPLAVLVLAPVLGGHAGVTSPRGLMAGTGALHVLAMSSWLGGLALLLAAVPAATRRLDPPDRSRVLAATLARASPLFLAAVLALVASGTLQSIVHLQAVADLVDTAFGRAVAVKVALLCALVALGAVQRRRVMPALRRAAQAGTAPAATGRLLRRTLRAEVVVLAVVLGATGALVGSSPPASPAGGPVSERATMGPLLLEVTLDPAQVGPNELHLYLFRRADGTQFDGSDEVRATLSQPGGDIGDLPVTLRKSGPGHFVADTLPISPAGDWELEVVSRVGDFDEHRVTVEVPVR